MSNVQSSSLKQATTLLGKVVEAQSLMPILRSIHVHPDARHLHLTASDLETTLTVYVPSDENKPGDFCIPYKTVSKLLSTVTTDWLPFHLLGVDGEDATIQLGKLKAKGVEAAQYPSLPEKNKPDPSVKQVVFGSWLLDQLQGVAAASSTDETRFNLNGVYFDRDSKRLVATDGHRLHYSDVNLNDLKESFILPSKAIKVLLAACHYSNQKDWRMQVDNRTLIVYCADFTLSARLIDGQFPDYNQVMPKAKGKRAVFYPHQYTPLKAAVKEVIALSKTVDEREPIIACHFKMESDRCIASLHWDHPALGAWSDEVVCGRCENTDPIGFNAHYLASFFNAGELANSAGNDLTLMFETHDILGPAKLQAGDLHGIVMPSRLTK